MKLLAVALLGTVAACAPVAMPPPLPPPPAFATPSFVQPPPTVAPTIQEPLYSPRYHRSIKRKRQHYRPPQQIADTRCPVGWVWAPSHRSLSGVVRAHCVVR